MELALEDGGGVGVAQFHGMWAIVAGGIPPDQSLRVMGERMPGGPDEGRWRRVWIEARDGEVAETRQIGHVLVDEARLMAVDADALGLWNDRDPPDGMADLVFWGRDAADTATEVEAGTVQFEGEGNLFGWMDLLFGDARERLERLRTLRSGGRKFAFDLRPHTHLWQIMRDVRATRTGSGVLSLVEAQLCMFMTTWGDGAFPAEADLDECGRILRLRIEVGCPAIVTRQRDVEERWFGEFAKRAIVSGRVVRDGEPVRYLYREAPGRPDDSGWRVFAGDEGDDYLSTPGNAAVITLRELLERAPGLKDLLRTPAPCAFECKDAQQPLERVDDFDRGEN